ncbi:MAG: hypothetical protein JNK46_02710 [Methylobacteriaceae bacterium]|nr:hypothetical protein [Methylobacteriaceae bacterium]
MDAFLRRVVVVLLALVCAGAAAAAFVPLAVLVNPMLREAGGALLIFAVLGGVFDLFGETGPWLLATAAALAWAFVVAVIGAPLFLSAFLSESFAIRSLVWHMAVPGVLAALAPWAARATDLAGDAIEANGSAIEIRLLLVFFLAGCLGGLVYWAIAGRNAGGDQDED